MKKIELIEWLVRVQDESLLEKIEDLRKGSIKDIYEQRIPKTLDHLQAKVDLAERDISEGKVYSQDEVEAIFKNKFRK